MNKRNLTFWIIVLGLNAAISGQWRGPDRDGHFPSTGLLTEWPEGGPELVYEVSGLGDGYSSPVVHRGNIYVTGKMDSMDVLSELSMDGLIRWQVPFGYAWQQSYTSTRPSPTIEGSRAYLLSGIGQLVCMDIETQAVVWSVNVDETFGAVWDTHGVSETLLLVDDLVICTPSGPQTTMVAFNKGNGQLVWKTSPVGGRRSYVSPVLYEYKDIRYILGATTWSYFAVDPETGELQWHFPYYLLGDRNTDRGTLITFTPIFRDDEILITTGYDYPAIMLKVSADGMSVTEKWSCPPFDTHHGHVVRVGEYLYGSNWHNNSQGEWQCVDWNTGELKWTNKWFSKGSIISADGMIYIYEERQGNVGLLLPDPGKFHLQSTFRIKGGDGPHWAHPVIYEGLLLIRHGDHLMVYNVANESLE